MGGVLSTYDQSIEILNAYRTWAAHEESLKTDAGLIVYMDDLTLVPRSLPSNFSWRNVILDLGLQYDAPKNVELRKVSESRNFLLSRDKAPSRSLITECGGFLIPEDKIEAGISSLSEEIDEIERSIEDDFPQIECDAITYTKDLAKSGFRYTKELWPTVKEFDLLIEPMPSHNLFLAQVITDLQGRIVCRIREDSPINARLAYTAVHEVLGHVLHFTQLRDNKTLSQEKPHLLALSLHTHEAFFIEGVTQLFTYYLLTKSAWAFPGSRHAALSCVKHMKMLGIMYRVTLEILDGKTSLNRASSRHLDFEKQPQNVQFLQERYEATMQDLFSAKVMLNFFASFCEAMPLARLDVESFFKVLPEFMSTYFIPETFLQFVSSNTK